MNRATPPGVMSELGRLFDSGSLAGLGEGQLIERFVQRRDPSALEALVHRHGPMVLAVCRRILRDPQDVEDAFQATFLVFVRKAASIRNRGVVGPWLYAVASKTALRARANGRRLSRLLGSLIDPDDIAANKPGRPLCDEQVGILDEEIGRLPEKYRAPVVLCYFEGLTHDQAAERLRWPVGTVRGRLARARDRLRARLDRRGVGPAAVIGLSAGARWPAVSIALSQATCVAARGFVACGGKVGPSVVASSSVLFLTRHILRGFVMSKLASVAAVLTVAGLITTGAVVGRGQDQPPAATPTANAAPVAVPNVAAGTAPAQIAVEAQPVPAATPAVSATPAAITIPVGSGSAPAIIANTPAPNSLQAAAGLPARMGVTIGGSQNTTPAPAALTRTTSTLAIDGPPAVPNSAEFLQNTQRQLDLAIAQLAAEQKQLSDRLRHVEAELARLKDIRAALSGSAHRAAILRTDVGVGLLTDRVVPVDAAVGLTVTDGPALTGTEDPTAEVSTTAAEALTGLSDNQEALPQPAISTGLESKLDGLIQSLAELRKEVDSIKNGNNRGATRP